MEDGVRRDLVVFGVTSISAFWVNAIGHLVLLRRRSPLVRDHKATLSYRSALVGDSTLLPLMNVFADHQLDRWGVGLHPSELDRPRLRRSVIVGVGLTAFVHGFQAVQKLTNWTMPRPWRWTMLGYYHALYMATQFVALAYFIGTAVDRVRRNGVRVLLTRPLAGVLGAIVSFSAILYKDYY